MCFVKGVDLLGIWYIFVFAMQSIRKQYYTSEDDLLGVLVELKSSACPYCGGKNTLILHGFLYGYDDESVSSKVVTGRRVICNNRRKNNVGCGHTLNILKSTKIKNFTITALSIWTFLLDIFLLGKKEAFNKFSEPFSISSCYRLVRRFKLCQSGIRSLLIKDKQKLKIPMAPCSLTQTVAHLKDFFSGDFCPIAAFQSHFQRSFF